jgi:hypothetical protein
MVANPFIEAEQVVASVGGDGTGMGIQEHTIAPTRATQACSGGLHQLLPKWI